MQLCSSLSILWHCLSLGLEWKLTFFQSCGQCWVFQICWHIECSTFTASSFRIWNSSTGIPSLPLALFVVMLPKAPLTSHSRMSGSRRVITPSWLSESWRTVRKKKKDLHDPDNHDGVITHLEPDILECEVKWALESITMNKASGGVGIPVELFQIVKDDAVKVLHSICRQIWKTQHWPKDWKNVSFHSSPKERQCQRMLKLLHNCTHLTR